MKFKLFVVFALLFSISACDTEIDLLNDWQEKTVVYGLLNPNDATHYIRVQKVFLGEGNALQMSQVGDSIYYGSEITVSMQRIRNGQVLQNIPLARDSSVIKNEGDFNTTGHVLFATSEQVFTDSDYRLTVTNEKTGTILRSSTPVVDSIQILSPNSSPLFFIPWNDPNPLLVAWQSGADGKIFNFTLRFYFVEREIANPMNIDSLHIDFVFPQLQSRTTKGGERFEIGISGVDFYQFVAQKLKAKPGYERVAGKMDFLFTAGAQDLAVYTDANQAPTTIVQVKPTYTNITGGLGLFSSRLNMGIIGKRMNSISVDELACGNITKHLGFKRNDGTPCN